MTSGLLLSVAIHLPAGTPPDTAAAVVAMAGRLGFIVLHGSEMPGDGADGPAEVVAVNDPAVVRAARERLDAAGARRPLLVAVPISVGRTVNEATARADLEPRFDGPRHPRVVGIFGAFEQAQEQVLVLARAGADGLVLDIPLARDVADVLAQIRALVVGATPQLRDGARPTDRSAPPRTVFYG